MSPLLGLPVLPLLALSSAAWRQDHGHVLPLRDAAIRWYAGDTHEHFQSCFTPAQLPEEIFARLEAEDLDVGSVLVWDPLTSVSFTEFACVVTGSPDPLSTPRRVLQFGIETSGLDCDKWGHLIGLGIGPEQALIAASSLAAGDCADSPGLVPGCGGDGTGVLAAPVAEHFYQDPDAVCGYAHSIWPLDDYYANGFPWYAELVASGFTSDARCIDPGQRLAVPNLLRLLVEANIVFRTFFPLLGAADAVLGDVQFLETIALGPEFPYPFRPLANWQGLTYRFASLGLRVALAAGSDQDCALVPQDQLPRTYVWLEEPFSYEAWTRGLAAGHTTIGVPGLRLDLAVRDRRVGEELYVRSPETLEVRIEVESDGPLTDGVELLVGGEVVATQPLSFAGGLLRTTFEGVAISESTWLGARLTSQRAHTGALYVYADGQPISDCQAAEYWMLWCDIAAKTALQLPQLELFGCQRVQALARLARARRAFKAYRDVEGFDPSFAAMRYGRSTPGSRGPISIGTTGLARSHQSLLLTCVNAPALADGTLTLSRTADLAGTCAGGARLFLGTGPAEVIATFPARSTRSGYAEVLVPQVPHGETQLFAQFVWTNPPGQRGLACEGAEPVQSASDALSLVVEVPPLTSLAVTPTAPSIARGTSLALGAVGLFADGTEHDVTADVLWSSSNESVAAVENAPGSAGRVTGLAVGMAEIRAMDAASGLSGATPLEVTPAVLQTLEVTPTQASLALGFDQSFLALGTFSDATTQDVTGSVAWSSSDPDVARMSLAPEQAGLAESLALGSTSIEARDLASGIQGSAALSVTPPVLAGIEVTPPSPAIPLGTSQAFTATGVLSNGLVLDLSDTLLWSSASPAVAAISNAPGSAGLATSLSVGTTLITATDPATQLAGTTLLSITPAVLTALEVLPQDPFVPTGFTQAFTAVGTYSDQSTQDLTSSVTWSSSDPSVASLSNAPGSQGVATTLATGQTSVGATDPASLASGSSQLTVTPAVLVALTLAPTDPFLGLGTNAQFTALGTYSDGSTQDVTAAVTWSSSAPGVATVSNAPGSAGLATSLAVGTTSITALSPSGVTASTPLTVRPVLQTITVLPADRSIFVGATLAYAATGQFNDGSTLDLTGAVLWTSSSPAVAMVSNAPGSEGEAQGLAPGNTTLTATDAASGVSGATSLRVLRVQ